MVLPRMVALAVLFRHVLGMAPLIATPCQKICAVDGRTQSCIGCGRTLVEIGRWTRYTDAERAAIMAALPNRMALLQSRQPATGVS